MRKIEKLMSPRMLMIAGEVRQCTKVFDTGTDHAFIPIYLIEHDICEKAVASDVRMGPLEVAKKNIRKHSAEEKIDLSLCDGIANAGGCDAIIIAGMGGQLISEILERESRIAESAKQLILQPMNAPEKLRRHLWDNGFEIYKENLCTEKHKVYNVMCTRHTGEDTEYSEAELHTSKLLVSKGHPLLTGYLKPKINRLSDMVAGGNDPEQRNSKLLSILKELV